MIADSLAPVFALILLGQLLARFKLTASAFTETSDRLVYYVFFPALLFWKIGGLASDAVFDWQLYQATLCTILAVCLSSLVCIRMLAVPDRQAGSFSQGCYRANTYIGMAVVINALGEETAGRFGLFLGLVIPLVNVLAVSTLIWFSGKKPSLHQRVLVTGRSLLGNPLILACLAGLLYRKMGGLFSPLLDNTLRLAASVSLPLALISIGGSLSTKDLKGRLRLSVIAAAIKVFGCPAIGLGFLWAFGVDGISLKMAMIFLALPIAPSAYVLAAQLHGDRQLASASIVVSTLLALISLPVVMLAFT